MTKGITAASSPRRSERRNTFTRQVILLAAVAGLGASVLVGGPIGSLTSPAWAVSPYPAEVNTRPFGFADLVAKVSPAVISVEVKLKGTNGAVKGDEATVSPQPGSLPDGTLKVFPSTLAQGSGFFISDDGYAVTSHHVIGDAETVEVTTADGTIYQAKVVGADQASDLALIKLDGGVGLPFVGFASKAPRVGDWALAVGNSLGLSGTVTLGIVSAKDRDIGQWPYNDFIQLDAPINLGNSGGPTFDIEGNVIGVNTGIYSPSVGIGFAIPVDTAKAVIGQLKDRGFVSRGWIGVETRPVKPDLAATLGLKKGGGALVDDPQPDGPAAKAGVAAGDVITALDGTTIKNSRELARRIAALAPGTLVKLRMLRDGEEKTLALTLGESPNEGKAK
jgi:serine protease Do